MKKLLFSFILMSFPCFACEKCVDRIIGVSERVQPETFESSEEFDGFRLGLQESLLQILFQHPEINLSAEKWNRILKLGILSE